MWHCVGCECTGNSAPARNGDGAGGPPQTNGRITDPGPGAGWPSVHTGLIHFDFDITKRNWSRIQLFNNNVKYNLTPICHQGCERDILIFDIQLEYNNGY